MRVNSSFGRFLYFWVIRETQVVISTEIEHFLAFDRNYHILGRLDDSFILVGACSIYFRDDLRGNSGKLWVALGKVASYCS